MATMTQEELCKAGLRALRRELGAAGMIRFLQHFENGAGDYTAERWSLLNADESVDSIAKEIRQATAKKPKRQS